MNNKIRDAIEVLLIVMVFISVITGLLVLLGSCGGNDKIISRPTVDINESSIVKYTDIIRYHDRKEGVTCWIIITSPGPAMSCLRDEQK